MREVFAQMTGSILAALGEDALLRGVSAGKVNLEHGVQVYGENGAVFERSIATIDKQFDPKKGDELVLLDAPGGGPTGYWTLDGLFADNSFSVRFVVLPSSAQ